MIHHYDSEDKAYIAVDCIIFGFDLDQEELQLLLIKRDFEPKKGHWSLMGGFLKKTENLNQAAARVLYHLTGLHDIYMEQLNVFSEVDRDPGDRTISVPYYALINIAEHNTELIKRYSAQWFNLSELPDLIFDHNDIVRQAIKQLQYKTSVQPIGFELLPEKFTMRHLQKLYEAIMREDMDKRNFTKKINGLDILVKLNEKDMESSKKGSFLYKFDQKKYLEKVSNGFVFKL
ncbi:MAG: NUDIX domain-containing protein [Saprospiraceae bacterium]|nr:NUDIX domain-containing protein [Saprospiraceae bacterium]